MYQNKFNIGDKVKVLSGEHLGESCVVTAIREDEVDVTKSIPGAFYFGVGYEYHYQLKALDNGDSFKCEEKELELIPKTQEELNMEFFKEAGRLIDPRPKFQIGDVVMLTGGKRQYVIKESIINLAADGHVVYEAAPLNNEDELYHYMESALEFQYHDKNWEYQFTEGARNNGLPAWRGKTYNLFMFYKKMNYDSPIDEILCDEYNNDTIPPKCMKHILKGHSILARIETVVSHNQEEIMKALNITSEDELSSIKESIKDKLELMNKTGASQDIVSKMSKESAKAFTKQELQLVDEVDRLDYVKGVHQDHYPVDLTNLQIMEAIKEAYSNAIKTGSRNMSSEPDKRHPEKGDVTPIKGVGVYEGETTIRNHKLVIHIEYNYDLNFIDTAYPLGKNNDAKRHSPKTESTDISDKEAMQNYLKNKGMSEVRRLNTQLSPSADNKGLYVNTGATGSGKSVNESTSKVPFQVGNRVKIIDGFGLDGVGVILEAGERDYEYQEFRVRLDGENADRIYYKKNMELISETPYFESSGIGPKFRSGDVVYIIDTPYKTNVAIMEAVSQDETSGEYIYKAALTFNGNIHQYHESELSYLYHDSKREIHK